MGLFANMFNTGTGIAHNGPQPPAPPAPAPAGPPAAPAPAPAPAEPQTAVSHLDAWTSLWQNPTTEDGKPAPMPVDPLRQPLFTLDPAKIAESAGKMDFTGNIPPETLARMTAGGADSAAAFQEALNIGIRNAVIGLTVNQGNLVNQAVLENNTRISGALPSHIKKVQLLELGSDDPVMSHPAVQPLVNSLKQMAFAKDPNASPAEVNKQVSEYIRGMGAALQETDPTVVAAKKTAAKGEQDWGVFLGVN